MLVHDGLPYTWNSLEPWDINCKAVECSVCGSCTPEALEKALDDGVEVQWDGFMEDDHATISLFADELELEEMSNNERHEKTYYRHCRTFHLTHLWAMAPGARDRLLNKLCESSDAEPDHIFEQFDLEGYVPTPYDREFERTNSCAIPITDVGWGKIIKEVRTSNFFDFSDEIIIQKSRGVLGVEAINIIEEFARVAYYKRSFNDTIPTQDDYHTVETGRGTYFEIIDVNDDFTTQLKKFYQQLGEDTVPTVDTFTTTTNSLWVDGSVAVGGTGTPSSPFKTIQAAANAVNKTGTTIYIKGDGNVYAERVQTQFAGESGKPVSFVGYGATKPIVYAPSIDLGGSRNNGLVELRHSYNQLINIAVRGRTDGTVNVTGGGSNVLTTWPTGGDKSSVIDGIVVKDCYIYDAFREGFCNRPDMRETNAGRMMHDLTIQNCEFYNNMVSLDGQGASIIADNFLVEGCLFRDNRHEQLDLWYGACNGEVRYNTFFASSPTPVGFTCHLYTDCAHYITIHHNLCVGGIGGSSSQKGIYVAAEMLTPGCLVTDYIEVFNNIIYNLDPNNAADGQAALMMWTANATNVCDHVNFYNNTVVNSRKCFMATGAGTMTNCVAQNNLGFFVGTDKTVSGSGLSVAQNTNIFVNQSTVSNYLVNATVYPTITGTTCNANGFKLKTGTNTAVNTGTANPGWLTNDFEGLTRPYGVNPDVGACERQT